MRNRLAFLIGKFTLFLLRLLGRNAVHVPGAVAFKISKDVIHFIDVPRDVIMITGTNGKSTTTFLTKHIFETAGRRVAYNTESNNRLGIISGLLKSTTWRNRTTADILVLEVAEEAMHLIPEIIKPTLVLVTNVQQDTVQLNASADFIYERIQTHLGKDTKLILNNEDPMSLSLARLTDTYYTCSVAKNAAGSPKDAQYGYTMPCPLCSEKIDFESYNISNIGKFRCTNCDLTSRDHNDFTVTAVDYEKGELMINGETLPFHYRAPHFVYDYVFGYALAKLFGIETETIAKAFDTFENIGGRTATLHIAGVPVQYLRFKQDTPDTLQGAIDVITADRTPNKLIVFSLNLDDNVIAPVFTNTFYTYHCNFERLATAAAAKYICAGDVVAYDTAIRLSYAGIPGADIHVLATDDVNELAALIRRYTAEKIYIVTWLHHFHNLTKEFGDA
jgi:UDP-N-acetylmuramyl tripeptide synthase